MQPLTGTRRHYLRLSKLGRAALAATAIGFAALGAAPAGAAERQELRVCAYADSLPFSNRERQGFENKIAELVAGQLGAKLATTWWPRPEGLIRHALNSGLCDVVIGVPRELASVETTQPYYWSSYVFISRADRNLDISSIKDPRLKHLRIGVETISGDRFYTPPARMLTQAGIVDNLIGYSADEIGAKPPGRARIIADLARGTIDVAAIWGPVGGPFAQQSGIPLKVVPIGNYEMFSNRLAHFSLAAFQYDIAMGVRRGDDGLRRALDRAIAAKQPQITQLLRRFGVPLINPVRAVALATAPGGPAE